MAVCDRRGAADFGLGWREALIVAVAVPVVFGLTLAVNLLSATRSTG